MADWFDEVVAEVCAEVVGSDDVKRKLHLTDRVTAQSVIGDITGASDVIEGLRGQFAETLETVRRLDGDREARLSELLPRESEAVSRAASKHLAERMTADAQSAAAEEYPVDRMTAGARHGAHPVDVAMSLLRSWFGSRREPATVGADALGDARAAFRAAADSDRVRQDQAIRENEAGRGAVMASLRSQLGAALTLRVNGLIDAALAASFEREFSYLGSARLADRADPEADQASGQVNAAAIKAIQGMINDGFTGAVGVAGPRGIGKSTLLARFARTVRRDMGNYIEEIFGVSLVSQWGVCVAAPAQYEARDFLLHLFGQLCTAVLGADRAKQLEDELTGTTPRAGRPAFPFPWLGWYAGFAALLCAVAVVVLETAKPVRSARSMSDLLIAGCLAAVAVATAVVPDRPLREWVAQSAELANPMPQTMPSSVFDFYGFKQDWIRRRVRNARLSWRAIVMVSAIAAGVLVNLVAVGRPVNPGYPCAAGLALAAGLLLALGSRFLRPQPGEAGAGRATVRSAAEDWYRRVKFQQTFTTGWSGTVTLAPSALPVQAQAGWSGSNSVAPVSMSVPELVAGFRAFTTLLRFPPPQLPVAGRERPQGPAGKRPPIPVVIGIDEVDKIEDPQTAQAFFNQIKGLFGDTQCLFLISISNDALAAYERRGLPLRDAFDSSLSTVITLAPLSRPQARTLTGSRLVRITEPAADLLYVLSGGLPRELVRLIRRAVDFQRAYSAGGAVAARPDAATLGGAQAVPAFLAQAGPAFLAQFGPAFLAQAAAMAGGQDGAPPAPPVPLDVLAVALIAEQVAAQRLAVLIRATVLEPCAARDTLLVWAGDPAGDEETEWRRWTGDDARIYFADLAVKGRELMRACDGTLAGSPVQAAGTRPHTDGCAAGETGALLFWLATVGQVFGACVTRDDFETAQRKNSDRSFELLARAHRNFPLGPHYVDAAVTAVRTAWGLTQPVAVARPISRRGPRRRAPAPRPSSG
jgi:hypothetical protein